MPAGAAVYALALLTTAILMVTLAPFDFHWFAWASHPAFHFTRADVAQNVLLFAPIGFVLARTGRVTFWQALLASVILSGFVEFWQLSIPGRNSNAVDILTNGTGEALGWLGASIMFRKSKVPPRQEFFALLSLPLCWVIALRTYDEPNIALLVLPVVLAGINNWPTSRFHQVLWLAAALLPLLYAARAHLLGDGFGLSSVTAFVPLIFIAVITLLRPQLKLSPQQQFWCLILTLISFVAVDAQWFLTSGLYDTWTARSHLHWAAIAAMLALTIYHYVWLRPQLS
jgi:VanZ family protein